jgi:RHS repeat-associated protein
MGGKLVAEYRPADNRYYYYTTDQIGSTRIVTDQNGVVVYAVAHDPYGGIQQTWESGYDPALKFSGKERDTESGLDYFGARYYDHTLYRFLSVDPVVPAGAAVADPQRWNLYGYCRNNPVNIIDSDGNYGRYVHWNLTYDIAIKIGIPTNIAKVIADANQSVDEKILTTSYLPWGYPLHFVDQSILNRAYELAYSTLDPSKIGYSLHTIQDYYCHLWYSNRPWPLGHGIESARSFFSDDPMNDPDYAFRDLEVLAGVVEETTNILADYKRRLDEAAVAVMSIFQFFLSLIPFLAI